MTTVEVKQELGLRNNRILEIKIGFILLVVFTCLSVISAILFINHLWSSNIDLQYSVVFVFELIKLILITVVAFMFYLGFSKIIHLFQKKSKHTILFLKITFSIYLVVYFVLSFIYLIYSFDNISSENVANLLGKDLVSMLVLIILFLLLSILLQREFRTLKSRLFLSFQSLLTFLIIPATFACIFLFTYNDYARQINDNWHLYFIIETQIGLSFFFFYSLVVVVSSIIFLFFLNRVSEQVSPYSDF